MVIAKTPFSFSHTTAFFLFSNLNRSTNKTERLGTRHSFTNCHSQKRREKKPPSPRSSVTVISSEQERGSLSFWGNNIYIYSFMKRSPNNFSYPWTWQIFLPTLILLAPRGKHETLISRIVLSPALLKAASNPKQKSLGFNFSFHLL